MGFKEGDYINRFQILSQIGEGGAGCVYEVNDPHMDQRRAIKVLKEEHCSNPELLNRFRTEARATARIDSNPNIVKILHVDVEDGRPYIVMELAKGTALNELIAANHSFSSLLAVNIGIQLATGLAHAHKNNIIHRDIKPANIICSITGDEVDLQIADLGIAYISDSIQIISTEHDVVVGTFQYMAPEQYHGIKPLDGRADLYSVGVVLHEIITGKVPFKGNNSIEQNVFNVARDDQSPLAELSSNIPPLLYGIIDKLLQEDRENRHLTGDELAADLKKARNIIIKNRARKPKSLHAKTTILTCAIALLVSITLIYATHNVWKNSEANRIIESNLAYADNYLKQSVIPLVEENWNKLGRLVNKNQVDKAITTLSIFDHAKIIRADMGSDFNIPRNMKLLKTMGPNSVYSIESTQSISWFGISLPAQLLSMVGLNSDYRVNLPVLYQSKIIVGYVQIGIDQSQHKIDAINNRALLIAIVISFFLIFPVSMIWLGRKYHRAFSALSKSLEQLKNDKATIIKNENSKRVIKEDKVQVEKLVELSKRFNEENEQNEKDNFTANIN